MDADLATVTTEADRLIQVIPTNGRKYIVHIEPQSGDTTDLPLRMLRYAEARHTIPARRRCHPRRARPGAAGTRYRARVRRRELGRTPPALARPRPERRASRHRDVFGRREICRRACVSHELDTNAAPTSVDGAAFLAVPYLRRRKNMPTIGRPSSTSVPASGTAVAAGRMATPLAPPAPKLPKYAPVLML